MTDEVTAAQLAARNAVADNARTFMRRPEIERMADAVLAAVTPIIRAEALASVTVLPPGERGRAVTPVAGDGSVLRVVYAGAGAVDRARSSAAKLAGDRGNRLLLVDAGQGGAAALLGGVAAAPLHVRGILLVRLAYLVRDVIV